MRIKLTIAYDGRPHEGWQSQPHGNTIQDLLEKAASATAKTPIRIHGAGRTDAGVHALAQVAHFDAPEHLRMVPSNWIPALNTKLPPSIRIMAAEEVGPDFHARFSAVSKTYRYRIVTEPVLSPFEFGRAWHYTRALDLDLLDRALETFIGRHDFEAFSARRGNETAETDFHRTLTVAERSSHATGWHLTFKGDGFLYKMVRLLAGSAVHVASGQLDLRSLTSLLDQPYGSSLHRSSFMAPAGGLVLEAVTFSP